jgi:ADP-ribosylglycohydrolase
MSAGHPTDDSELTAALALSLVECQGFNPGDVFYKLRDFIFGNEGNPPKRHSYLTKGEAYGSGGTLRSALKAATYQGSLEEFLAGNVRILPTNGALMRCAPIAEIAKDDSEAAFLGGAQSPLRTYTGRQSSPAPLMPLFSIVSLRERLYSRHTTGRDTK